LEFAFYQILSLAAQKKDILLPIKKVIPVLQYSISLAGSLYYELAVLSMVFSKNNRSLSNHTPVCHPERRKTLAFCAVEVLRVERKRTSKTEERRDEGISEQNWVACHSKCYIDSKATEICNEIPRRLKASRFFFALRSEKVRQAQDDIQCYCYGFYR
jgi:hypothetical protein